MVSRMKSKKPDRNGTVAVEERDDLIETPDDSAEKLIYIPEKQTKAMQVKLRGTAPLLVCRFSQKALMQIIEDQSREQGDEKRVLQPRDLEQEYLDARYQDAAEGWDGMNVLAFKAAMVQACRLVSGIAMTQARVLFRVYGQGQDADGTPLARIRVPGDGKKDYKPDIFKNWVRVGKGSNTSAIPRWRPMYGGWSVDVVIHYHANKISAQSVINLLAYAGESGVGDWRPSSPRNDTGTFGTFEVDPG